MAPRKRDAAAHDASDGDDLIVEGFRFSDNQDRYQAEALKQKGSHPCDGPNVFYKDATPKADHYIQFVVRLPAKLRRKGQPEPDWRGAASPLDVELGFAPTDADPSYARVADQGHLRRCESPRRDGDAKSGVVERPRVGAVLRYRIELGSYRQGDRRFCLRVSLMKRDDVGEAGPAHTPAVYVASKVKRPRAKQGHSPPRAKDSPRAGDDDDGDDHSVSPHPPPKRAANGARAPSARPPRLPDFGSLAELGSRIEGLERLLTTNVLPQLQRIEDKMNEPPPPLDALDNTFEGREGDGWEGMGHADVVGAMGTGLQEAELQALALLNDSQEV